LRLSEISHRMESMNPNRRSMTVELVK